MKTFYQCPLYTGELRKTVRFYSCKSCGQTIKVGLSEKIKTIEELKSKGCSKCSNQIFNLIDKNKV